METVTLINHIKSIGTPASMPQDGEAPMTTLNRTIIGMTRMMKISVIGITLNHPLEVLLQSA